MATPAPFARCNIGDLTERIALITGASSGIGRMIAQAYAAAGAYIVVADITPNPPATPLLAATAKSRGTDLTTPTVELVNSKWPAGGDGDEKKPRAIYMHCDVTRAESVEAAVKATAAQYGRLDIMVNNAGAYSPSILLCLCALRQLHLLCIPGSFPFPTEP